MRHYSVRFSILAFGVAGMAGYVDAIGFLKLGGLFVSFMSGNSTQLAVGIIRDHHMVIVAGKLLVGFVAGVVAGTVLATVSTRYRKPIVLILVGTILAIAAYMNGRLSDDWTTMTMAGSMGAANTVFQRDGEVSIGVTYMTGTLVKLGQRLAGAAMGGLRWAWLPYLMLWAALVGGAVAGALAYSRFGTNGIWAASLGAILLAAFAAFLGPVTPTNEKLD